MHQDDIARLIEKDQRKLYVIAYRLLRNEQDALDAVSETAYRACRKAASLRNEQAASGWLCAIAVNCCRDMLRKRRVDEPYALDRLSVPDEANHFDARDMVHRLPKRESQIMLLRFFAGLTPAEIARQLHIPESTVRSRIDRALSRLRLQLEEG